MGKTLKQILWKIARRNMTEDKQKEPRNQRPKDINKGVQWATVCGVTESQI